MMLLLLTGFSLWLLLMTADKPKQHDRFTVYRNCFVRIGEVPTLTPSQMN